MNFDGKTVLATGGASGIGQATCQAFAKAGARVVLTDLNPTGGESAAAAIRAAGGDCRFLQLDITDRAAAEALAARVRDELGRLDVLVNAAGWDIIEPFMDNTPEYWAKIVALNFMGPVQVTRAMLPLLFECGNGRIVNISSDAGRVGSFGETVYAGAKGGVIAFTKSLAQEVGPLGITVNNVPPSFVYTEGLRSVEARLAGGIAGYTKSQIPVNRVGQPEDIAHAVAFLASEASGYITGLTLSVNGGRYMQ